jgi:hypothetical protein
MTSSSWSQNGAARQLTARDRKSFENPSAGYYSERVHANHAARAPSRIVRRSVTSELRPLLRVALWRSDRSSRGRGGSVPHVRHVMPRTCDSFSWRVRGVAIFYEPDRPLDFRSPGDEEESIMLDTGCRQTAARVFSSSPSMNQSLPFLSEPSSTRSWLGRRKSKSLCGGKIPHRGSLQFTESFLCEGDR